MESLTKNGVVTKFLAMSHQKVHLKEWAQPLGWNQHDPETDNTKSTPYVIWVLLFIHSALTKRPFETR